MLSGFSIDIRHAVRRLAAHPGFTAAAVLTIALGVGLNAGVFSVVDGLLFSDLPVPAGHELVDIRRVSNDVAGGSSNPFFTVAQYRSLRDRTETLSGIAGQRGRQRALLGGETQRELLGTIVSCNYFDVLRQPPVLGRGLVAGDCERGAAPVVVLGHGLWESEFDADPTIVGESIVLSRADEAGWQRHTFTVIGIAAADTHSPGSGGSQFYAPYAAMLSRDELGDDGAVEQPFRLTLIGRCEQGMSLEQVAAELDVIAAELEIDAGTDSALPSGATRSIRVERARRYSMSNTDAVASAIGVTMPFALVLLMVCANVANLFLARATARTREIAMRLSLGASRARVIRQLLTETTLIAFIGGALGSLLAFWSFDAVVAFIMSAVPDPSERIAIDLTLDIRVLAFVLALSLGTGILCGLVPALRSTRHDLNTAMKPDAVAADGRPRGRLQSVLVGVQVAVCIVLTAVTGLFLRDFYVTNAGIDPGFDYEDVVVASILHPRGDTAEAAMFRDRLAGAVRSLPGVEAVGYTSYAPWGDAPEVAIGLSGQSVGWANFLNVSPGYFGTLGVPIVRGRNFTGAELADGSDAVIVSESLARELWPERDPIGKTLTASRWRGRENDDEVVLRVVGVSRDAQIERIGEPTYAIHRPLAAGADRGDLLVVRSRMNLASVTAALRAAVRDLNPQLDARVWSLADSFGLFRYQSRFAAMLTLSVGGLALVLASVGIYGVVAYVVGRRTREISIRLALGAQARNVLAAILGRTMRPVVVGAAIGVVAAAAAAQLLGEALIAVSPFDPIGIAGSALFVLGVAMLASFVPARRGLGIDPIATLRYE